MRRVFSILYIAESLLIDIVAGSESPSIGNLPVFPADNPWNWDIRSYAVHPNSINYINSIGENETLHPDFGNVWNDAPNGIPYIVVDAGQPLLSVLYTLYGNESDPGPFPIPLAAPIEGGNQSNGDRHVIALDTAQAMLYELYRAFPAGEGWQAASGAKYDLTSNALRPEGWTSADAAGLPIFPGLVRYEEVYIKKHIGHALRFTVEQTQRMYIYPARHYASSNSDPDLPPMGLRVRLKADFDIGGFSEPVQVILLALKKYGMFVADNGGNWFISGAPDDRWDDDILGELKSITGSNFEVVMTVDSSGNPIYPPVTPLHTAGNDRPFLSVSGYPSPFNSTLTLTFTLPQADRVSLKIYNVSGQEIAVLVNGYRPAGQHEVKWVPDLAASGIYFYRFKTAASMVSGKIIYQK
jgi:hypothetical protein